VVGDENVARVRLGAYEAAGLGIENADRERAGKLGKMAVEAKQIAILNHEREIAILGVSGPGKEELLLGFKEE